MNRKVGEFPRRRKFWHGLKAASGAIGFIGGPELLLPHYFQETIAADDEIIRVPLPSGVFAPRSGRYVVDLLHMDATFQERMRVHACMEFIVVTRHSALERVTEAMLCRRYIQFHTIPKGSVVAARKASGRAARLTRCNPLRTGACGSPTTSTGACGTEL